MEATKTLMAQFYSRCQENGYTDMNDANQSLKAKMIAMELKLDYGDIAAFYQEAQRCHEQVAAEQKRLEEERRIQQQKEDQEAARRAVDGQLLASLYDIGHNSKSQISVYQRPDKSIYYTIGNGQRNEGVPEISVHKSGSLQYTYHPSQAVYTGATVGGVTTGGVHHTKASLSERVDRSNKGYFEVKAQDTSFEVNRVELSDYTCNRFARDTSFARYVENKKIVCYDPSVKSSLLTYAANPTSSLSYYDRLSIGSMALDERRLPFDTSAALARLVGQIIHAQFPPTDEEYYNKAVGLAKKETSAELKQAVDLFMHIRDYRDAAEQAVFANDHYQSMLKKEEEEAAKEAAERAKIIKNVLKIAIPIVAACIAIVILINMVIIPNNEYKKAVALMNDGQYQKATTAFVELDGYKDSEQKIIECGTAILDEQYDAAVALMDAGQYSEASSAFKALGTHRDSEQKVTDCTTAILDGEYDEAVALMEAGKYEEAISVFDKLNGHKDSDAQIENCNVAIKDAEYHNATLLLVEKKYEEAYDILVGLGDYKNAAELLTDHFKVVYQTKIKTQSDDKFIYEYSYDSAGNVVKEVSSASSDGSWMTIEYSYDLDGNLIEEIETWSAGNRGVRKYFYDSDGNLLLQVNTYSNGRETTYEYSYNSAGNQIKKVETRRSNGDVFTDIHEYSYDSAGNKIKQVNTLANGDKTITEYSYDSAGNLVEKVDTLTNGAKTISEYNYDSAGNCIKLVVNSFNGSKNIYEYTYDSAGNRIKQVNTYASGVQDIFEYRYDSAGNCVKRVDTCINSNGNISTEKHEYSYDSAGNLVKEVYTVNDGDKTTTEYSDPIVICIPAE